MLYHLDSLNGATRLGSSKYRFMRRRVNLLRLPRDYAWEMAVFVRTPGFTPTHICRIMEWKVPYYERELAPIVEMFDVEDAARANAHSITEADAQDILYAMRYGDGVSMTPPLPCLMWLDDQRRSYGRSNKELAEQFGVKPSTITTWRRGWGAIDPLGAE